MKAEKRCKKYNNYIPSAVADYLHSLLGNGKGLLCSLCEVYFKDRAAGTDNICKKKAT